MNLIVKNKFLFTEFKHYYKHVCRNRSKYIHQERTYHSFHLLPHHRLFQCILSMVDVIIRVGIILMAGYIDGNNVLKDRVRQHQVKSKFDLDLCLRFRNLCENRILDMVLTDPMSSFSIRRRLTMTNLHEKLSHYYFSYF